MRACLAGMVAVLAALGLPGDQADEQKPPAADRPVPPLTADAARNYALYLGEVANLLASRFVRPVPPEKLAAAAAKGLYQAANRPLPDGLQDLEKAFAGKDPVAELTRIRQELGDVEALRGDAGIRVGIEAMCSVLDAHSTYLTVHEQGRFRRSPTPPVGVGLTLEERPPPGPLLVKLVALGEGMRSPAQQAGLRPGDRVLEIDGQPTLTLTVSQAMEKLNGLPETEVTLTVQTASDEARQVKLARKSFKEECVLGVRRMEEGWDYLLDRRSGIGLVRLTNLAKGASADLFEALVQLKEAGLAGLSLDLRDCPGGYLDEAVAVADLFWGRDLMATVQYRDELKPPVHPLSRTDRFRGFPMVVLIGPDTSGGGELIAAALEDYKRAAIAGQRSRGKGSVQELIDEIGGNHAVKLTTGVLIRPSKRNLHRFPDSKHSDDWGVRPNKALEVPLSPGLRRQLRLWRHLHDTRPVHSPSALPLDRPEADPVLGAALEFLKKQLHAEFQP